MILDENLFQLNEVGKGVVAGTKRGPYKKDNQESRYETITNLLYKTFVTFTKRDGSRGIKRLTAYPDTNIENGFYFESSNPELLEKGKAILDDFNIDYNQVDNKVSWKFEESDFEDIDTSKLSYKAKQLFSEEDKKLDEDIIKSIEPLDSEVAKEIDSVFASEDQGFAYKMLDRLRSDCAYVLGALKDGSSDNKLDIEIINKFLWFQDIDKQIAFMKGIYDRLDEKPEWISLEDINNYEKALKEIVRIEESLEEDLNTFDYDKLQKELEAIPNVTKIEFDKDLIYDTHELVTLIHWNSDSDTAQWFKDKAAVKTKAIKVFENNGLKLSDPVEDNESYYYFVLREIKTKNECLKEELAPEKEIEYALITMINSLIKDELEAIDGYNSAIVTLEAENKGEFTDLIRDIISEENIHVGQLQAILKELNPQTTEDIKDGQEEGEEQIDQALDSTKDESEETRTTIDTENGEIKTYKLDSVEEIK